MDRFSKFHPIVSFSFFLSVIVLTLIFSNPIFYIASLFCGFLYLLRLEGKTALGTLFKFILPMILLVGIFNMLFCSYGVTVLFSVKEYSFTLECLAAGLSTGMMLSAVIIWFSSFNIIVSSDKLMALFGGFAPNLTLLFSMVLRFIPMMKRLSADIKDAHKGMGIETAGVKNTLQRFSALISISLEKSIETADSMRARGFGSKKRQFYSVFKIRSADIFSLAFLAVLFIYMLYIQLSGAAEFSFNPVIELKGFNPFSIIAFSLYSLFPLLADLTEDVKWLFLKSKI